MKSASIISCASATTLFLVVVIAVNLPFRQRANADPVRPKLSRASQEKLEAARAKLLSYDSSFLSQSEATQTYDEFRFESASGFAKRVELPNFRAPDYPSPRTGNCGEYVAAAALAGVEVPISESAFQRLGSMLNDGGGISSKDLVRFLERFLTVEELFYASPLELTHQLDDGHAIIAVVHADGAEGKSPHWIALTGYEEDRYGELTRFRVADNGVIGAWISKSDFLDRWDIDTTGWDKYAIALSRKADSSTTVEYVDELAETKSDTQQDWHRPPDIDVYRQHAAPKPQPVPEPIRHISLEDSGRNTGRLRTQQTSTVHSNTTEPVVLVYSTPVYDCQPVQTSYSCSYYCNRKCCRCP